MPHIDTKIDGEAYQIAVRRWDVVAIRIKPDIDKEMSDSAVKQKCERETARAKSTSYSVDPLQLLCGKKQ